jgi:hypothetical protein
MKIDFDHWKGSQIADEIQNQLDLERRLSIIAALKPRLERDGNKWCYILGDMPEHYIAGFGDTPHDAMNEFVMAFYNAKAHPNG